eukprot:TRINITY_DN7809_c0_g1_i3.p1 TRINITY_DN7809_c0_g1~~TRINITY_DN7809_c0_g1_i3.p1  ORF type:complete len:302 (-),score=38.92 TRINITY_DN7809_c0_g1_i3:28-933(-)
MTSGSVLLYGASGWIGGKLVDILAQQRIPCWKGEARIEDRHAVEGEILKWKPSFVINCAGKTGRPNVDWCETHRQETIRSNVTGALTLTDVCAQHGVHLTHFATGCIYQYDDAHPAHSGIGFKEDDVPNFKGSFYSRTKVMLEDLLQAYPSILILRLRMPISEHLAEPRNFITKITNYAKVVNVPNSVTVLPDLLPVAVDMITRGIVGTYNFTNPGTITHNEILDLYTKYVDNTFTYSNFTLEEQAKVLKAERSNNELDVSKLTRLYPAIPHIHKSIHAILIQMRHNLDASRTRPTDQYSD